MRVCKNEECDNPAAEGRRSCYSCKMKAYRERQRARRDGTAHKYGEGEVPEGYHFRGVSQLVDGDGNTRLTWFKSAETREHKLETIQRVVDELEGVIPVARPSTPIPKASAEDLLCVYPMGDPHVGMYAWAEECGQDFDLEIAARNLATAFDHLVGLAPRSKHALIANLGDFFHADNPLNRTTRAGHALDVDTRWAKVLDVGIQIMYYAIDKALTKHEHVTVWCLIGNHDDCSSRFLTAVLRARYRDEPRVTIDDSPAKALYYRFGKVLLGGIHGDTAKMKSLGGIMSTDRAKDWGETEHRYWLTGHVHHESVIELPGCLVESFRTLAPKDAWASAAGYRAEQDMKLDTYHAEWGRLNRHRVGIRQVWDIENRRTT